MVTLEIDEERDVDEGVELLTLELVVELELINELVLLFVELDGATELEEVIKLVLEEDGNPEEAIELGCEMAKTKPLDIKTNRIMATVILYLNTCFYLFFQFREILS